MNKDAIRAAAFNKTLKIGEIANLKDFMPEWIEPVLDDNGQPVMEPVVDAEGKPVLDASNQPLQQPKGLNQVQLRELTGDEARGISKDAESSVPKLLALSLITRDKEQVFGPLEIGSIMNLGNTVLNPLAEQALVLSGLQAKEVADAKNG